MASSSKGKAKYSGPTFQDYLNGLQYEFELLSKSVMTKSPRPSRFDVYLMGLKEELKLMALEIESLQKQSNRYKEKVEVQAKELQVIRRNSVCGQCRGTTATSRVITSPAKTPKTPLSPSRSVSQPKSPDKRVTLGRDFRSQQTTHRSTQPTPLIRKTPTATTPTQPTQAVSDTTSQPADSIVTDPLPAIPSELSASNIDPVSSGMHRNWSVIFNKEVEKELDVEMAHVLLHGDTIWCVKFSKDGKYVAAGCKDGKAYIYAVQTGTLTCVLSNLLAKNERITAVCFSRDGKYLATGLSNGFIYIWEINKRYVRNAFKGHTNTAVSLDFSLNGRLLVSASDDNTVRLWDMRYGSTKILSEDNPTTLDDPCYRSAVFSPDGRYVAASHRDGIVRVWDVRTGRLMRRLKADTEWVNDVAFIPDGKGLLAGGNDSTLKYWDISTLYAPQTRHNSYIEASRVDEHTREFLGHQDFVYSLAVSLGGRWVASGSADQSVRLWDITTGAMQCVLDYGAWVYSVDFSPAGCHFASGEIDGAMRIWKYSHTTVGGS